MAPITLLAEFFAKAVSPFSIEGNLPAGSWSSIIGIVVALIGNFLISIALNVQRYAHIRLSQEQNGQEDQQQKDQKNGQGQHRNYGSTGVDQRADGSKQGESQPLLQRSDSKADESMGEPAQPKDKSYLSSPWWWLGITLMIIGESGNFLAYGFAPASIVSPLGVVALVSNCLIAPWMLHERFRKRDALGVLIAVAGCVVVVLSASGNNPKLDADKIWDLISTWEFETYFGITMLLIVVLMFASSKYGDRSILIDLGLVGLFGGYTALSTKGVASLLSNTIWRVVTFPVTYLLVFVLAFTAIMQVKYINRALQRFDSTQVIPTQFVMFTISVIVGSAILYRDFERRTAADAAKFFVGCALTFLGVYFITSGRAKGAELEDGDASSDGGEDVDLRTQATDREGQDQMSSTGQQLTVPHAPVRSQSSRSETPALRLFTQDEDEEEQNENSADLLVENPWQGSTNPGASAAIHHMPTRLPSQRTTSGNKRTRRPMHATTSDPILPTSALSEPSPNLLRTGGPPSPLLHRHTHDYGRPRTPENASPLLDPGSATTPRFGSIGRHSIADMLPQLGPLTNPLSNSLNVIIADSLRKGVDFVPGGSMRRRSIRQRRSKRFDTGQQFGRSLPEEGQLEAAQSSQRPRADGTTSGDGGGLGRKISSLFKGKAPNAESGNDV